MIKTIDNERGMALVLALIVMFLMSLLGTMLIANSTSETKGAMNYRMKQDSFYAAERAIEYARTDVNVYGSIGSGSLKNPPSGGSPPSRGRRPPQGRSLIFRAAPRREAQGLTPQNSRPTSTL